MSVTEDAQNRYRRPSAQAIKVLNVLMADPDKEVYGYDLARKTGLETGTLYVIFSRLEERGYLKGEWKGVDREDTSEIKRPKRMYQLTKEGQVYARKALQQFVEKELENKKLEELKEVELRKSEEKESKKELA
jgi:PadR family transcriptional regulator, regulatory protein PadR